MLTQDEVVQLLDIYSAKSSTSEQKANARDLLLVWLDEKREAKKKKTLSVAVENK